MDRKSRTKEDENLLIPPKLTLLNLRSALSKMLLMTISHKEKTIPRILIFYYWNI